MLLSLALAFAQWQGLVHAVLHPAPATSAGLAAASAHDDQPHHDDHDHDQVHAATSPEAAAGAAAWFEQLIPTHDDGGACRLFDQASHADVLVLAVTVAPLPPAPGAVPVVPLPVPRILRPVSTRARDPPATS